MKRHILFSVLLFLVSISSAQESPERFKIKTGVSFHRSTLWVGTIAHVPEGSRLITLFRNMQLRYEKTENLDESYITVTEFEIRLQNSVEGSDSIIVMTNGEFSLTFELKD